MNELALFAGAGGGILASKLLGWRTMCAVEINPYRARRLMQRQNEGHIPLFPIWDDVYTFNRATCKDSFDVVSGGFPCQDISIHGKGEGIEGERSGLWREMSRIIRQFRPPFAFVENTQALLFRGMQVVLRDLAEMGYYAQWGVLGSYHVGLDNKRERLWIVAYSSRIGRERRRQGTFEEKRRQTEERMEALCRTKLRHDIPSPDAFGDPVGLAYRMDRLQAIGDCQSPPVAATAWRILGGPVE